ncbi:GtrA family protein [Phreatobacter sp.]|uniref:GtrA family protein n=1 Tax=Phreatobacter sp. TaxID=1966341 RepID=UPI003F72D9E0
MAQKRVEHGPMVNGRQQDGRTDRAAGLLSRLVSLARREAPKLVSFGLIGVLNGVVNYAVTVGVTLAVLAPLALAGNDLALGAAKALGWAVAVSNSYLLNTWFTFADESGRRFGWATYLRFVASGTAGLVVEVGSFLLAVRFLPLALAAIVPIGLAFLVNFAMTRLLVFPDRSRREP